MPEEQNLDLWKNKPALAEALTRIPFFDSLSQEEMRVLMNFMSLYELGPGETLFKEGQVGQYVCFVVEGTMDVLKKSITGADVVITSVVGDTPSARCLCSTNLPVPPPSRPGPGRPWLSWRRTASG